MPLSERRKEPNPVNVSESLFLHWHERSARPAIIIALDDAAATWLCDALESHDPKDGATKELRRTIEKIQA